MPISNAANRPLFDKSGTVPDVSGALRDYFQLMTFKLLTKTVRGFQAMETALPINFQGVIQPFTARQLLLKPEGERGWTWFQLHADPVLILQIDDIVEYKGAPTRVMARVDYSLYGFVTYELVQDWER